MIQDPLQHLDWDSQKYHISIEYIEVMNLIHNGR